MSEAINVKVHLSNLISIEEVIRKSATRRRDTGLRIFGIPVFIDNSLKEDEWRIVHDPQGRLTDG